MEQVYPANAAAPADPAAPRWKCVLAATPQLLLAAQYLFAVWGVTTGIGAARLASVMWVEALMVSFVIYFGALWLWRPVDPTRRRIRFWLFLLLSLALAAYAVGKDPADTVLFVVTAVVTFFGLALSWRQRTALQQFVARWVVAYAAMFVLIEVIMGGAGIWRDQQKVLAVGAAYFGVLAAVEISGFYLQYIPRHSANLWETLKRKGEEILSRLQ